MSGMTLPRLASKYAEAKARLQKLESETGFISLTPRTVADIRHILDHLLLSVSAQDRGDSQKASYLLETAAEHLREHELNCHEVIAGKIMAEAKEQIEEAGAFTRTKRARALFKDAAKHFALGRNKRTEDEGASREHFVRACELALETKQAVDPPSTTERTGFWVLIFGSILSAINIVILLLSL